MSADNRKYIIYRAAKRKAREKEVSGALSLSPLLSRVEIYYNPFSTPSLNNNREHYYMASRATPTRDRYCILQFTPVTL